MESPDFFEAGVVGVLEGVLAGVLDEDDPDELSDPAEEPEAAGAAVSVLPPLPGAGEDDVEVERLSVR